MKTEDKDYYLDDQIGFILRLAGQYHTNIFMLEMIKNLTQTQFAALAKMLEIGKCSQRELGRGLMLDSATVSGVVDRMRSRGYIEVTNDPVDRRRQSLTLTDAGFQVASNAQLVAKDISEATLSNLAPNEQARLIHLLRKMMNKNC